MKRLLAIVAVALAPVAVSGCAADHSMHEVVSEASTYTSDEIMFAQMMIPHHQQAVEMSSMVPTKTDDPEIQAIAAEILHAQAPEIEQMKKWLSASGVSGMHHHMAMDGMLTDDQMAALKSATGVEFEKKFLSGMIEHHRGAIAMLDIIEGSTNSEVVTLRENIRSTQTAEIKRLQNLLKKY